MRIDGRALLGIEVGDLGFETADDRLARQCAGKGRFPNAPLYGR